MIPLGGPYFSLTPWLNYHGVQLDVTEGPLRAPGSAVSLLADVVATGVALALEGAFGADVIDAGWVVGPLDLCPVVSDDAGVARVVSVEVIVTDPLFDIVEGYCKARFKR